MKKLVNSLKLVVFIAGYFAAVSCVRSVNRSFDYYMRSVFDEYIKFGPAVSFALFIACAAALFLLVRCSKGSEKIRIWQRADYSLLVLLTVVAVTVCAHYVRRDTRDFALIFSPYFYRYLEYPLPPLILFAAAYIAGAALLMETAALIRDKRLTASLYWPRFFKLYPPRRPAGLLMALLLLGNLYIIFLGAAKTLRLGRLFDTILSRLDLPSLMFAVFTITALTYFCAFVLSLSEEYEKANAEKIRAERFKAELITNVSHDIRTPLTSIINYVDLLKALPVERDDFADYVSVLDKKSARLRTLIDDLMEASKAASGNVAVDLRETGLSEIVGQIAGEFDDAFAERGLTLVLRQPDAPVLVRADSRLLWRVLENLFGNAAKYALPGTRVFAEIVNAGGGNKAVFSLKNTSLNPIDMPADSLTEQFIRGDRARQTDGNGLGLYIAKSLVELIGGRLEIRATGDLFQAEIIFG